MVHPCHSVLELKFLCWARVAPGTNCTDRLLWSLHRGASILAPLNWGLCELHLDNFLPLNVASVLISLSRCLSMDFKWSVTETVTFPEHPSPELWE